MKFFADAFAVSGDNGAPSLGWASVQFQGWNRVLASGLALVLGLVPAQPQISTWLADGWRIVFEGEATDHSPDDLSAEGAAILQMPDTAGEEEPLTVPAGDFAGEVEAMQAPLLKADDLAVEEAPSQAELEDEAGDLQVQSRDEFSNTYVRPDGSQIRQVSNEALNFRTNAGWEEISTEITRDFSGWVAEQHPLSPDFTSRANDADAVTVTGAGHDVSFVLDGIGAGRGKLVTSDGAEKDTLIYENVADGVDLQYSVESAGLKEAVVLKHAPQGPSRWTWTLNATSLTPKLVEGGVVELSDGAGQVVMHVPPPVAWDSSGVDRVRSDAVMNPTVDLTQLTEKSWRYEVAVEDAWLTSAERVYPVYVDPTIQRGPDLRQARKSDGTFFGSSMHVGNTRQNNQDVHWRAFTRFDYGDVPGKFINQAQLGIAYAGQGTTEHRGGEVSHANCLEYHCTGTYLGNYGISNNHTWVGGDSIARRFVDMFRIGDRGVTFMIRGDETGGRYSHKKIETEVFFEYWDYPSVSQQSPGNGATGSSLTPTLQLTSQNRSPYSGLNYGFRVSESSNMSAPVWDSGWTSSSQVVIPEGKLASDRQYYWQVRTIDGHNGHLGQGTERSSGVWGFRTQKVAPTPPESTASPGNVTGSAQPVTTRTPSLVVDQVADADTVPSGGSVKYEFKLATGTDGRTGAVYTSGLIGPDADGKARWTVPDGVLQDGVIYSWIVQPHDGLDKNVYPAWVKKFRVDLRLGSSGPSPFEDAGPVGVNLANGNAHLSFSSPTVDTVGGPMGMQFTYNSQAVRSANHGLVGQYYDGRTSLGNVPANASEYTFDGKSPLLVRTDPGVNFEWGEASPGGAVPTDHFMARWTGFIRMPTEDMGSSRWKFGLRHDDGVRLRVNNELLIDQWSAGDNPLRWSAEKTYGTAQMPIQLDYYEITGGARIQLWADNLDDQAGAFPIPANWLTRQPSVLPEGWSASVPIAGEASAWSHAAITESAIVLTDSSGTTSTYTRTSAGGYSAPEGGYGRVSLDGQGRVVLQDEDGTTYQFTRDGQVESATPTQDAGKPATPISIRDSRGRVSEIVDPVSKDGSTYHRKVKFIYFNGESSYDKQNCRGWQPAYWLPPEGMLCGIEYPDGSKTDLYYGPNESLWMIDDPGGERTTFGYNNRILTSMQDSVANDYLWHLGQPPYPESTTTDLTYDTQNRVTSVKLPSADGEHNSARMEKVFSYNPSVRQSAVRLAGVAGSAKTFEYDDALREVSETSGMGVRSSNQWHPTKDLLLSQSVSNGTKSTTIFDPLTDRVTDTYGPAPAACFGADGRPVANAAGVAGCGMLPAHTQTRYDEGMQGLHAAYYSDTQQLLGQPKHLNLGLTGVTGGAIDRDWGTGAPAPGISADNFSIRLSGTITFPAAGSYTLRTTSDDGVRVWLNDSLIIDRWVPQSPTDVTASAISVAAGETRRIRVEYHDVSAGAMLQLKWATPSSANFAIVPGSQLAPDYGLTTSSTTADSVPAALQSSSNAAAPSRTSTIEYAHPWLGQPTRGVADPSGLKLTTTSTWEQPGAAGWQRRIGKSLPAATTPGAPSSATSRDEYYGDLEVAPAACGVGGVRQFGSVKAKVSPTPAQGSAVRTEYVYDVMGRVAGTKSSGEASWSCSEYDGRGTVKKQTMAAVGALPARTAIHSVAPGPHAGYRTTSSDNSIAESPNGSTVTIDTNLLDQVVRYEDVWGTVTEPLYNPLTGQLASVKTTPLGGVPSTTSFTYNQDGQTTAISLDGKALATSAFDVHQQLKSVDFDGGARFEVNQRDGAARVTAMKWSFPESGPVSASAVYSQSGKIVRSVAEQDSLRHESTFSYDGADRLVRAVIPFHDLSYEYLDAGSCGPNAAAGASGNRTAVIDAYTAPGQNRRVTRTNFCYDWADRLTSSVVSGAVPGAHAIGDGLAAGEIAYDARGNTTRLGDMTLAYDSANRHMSTSFADGTVMTIQRDVTGRVVSRSVKKQNATPEVERFLFSTSSDTPYATVKNGATTKQINLPGGASVRLGSGAADWSYAGMLGSTLMTSNGRTAGALQAYDPFGQPLDPVTKAIGTSAADNVADPVGRSGWHQEAQKLVHSAGSASVIEMGARLYVPALGRFLQMDPIDGGTDNDYSWPSDPINAADLDGKAGFDWALALDIASTVAMFVPVPGIAQVASIGLRVAAIAVRAAPMVARVQKAIKINQTINTPAYRNMRAAWFASSKRNTIAINRTFTAGSYKRPTTSFVYHYGKHAVSGARSYSPRQYLRSAQRELAARNRVPGTYRTGPGGKIHSTGRWSTYWMRLK